MQIIIEETNIYQLYTMKHQNLPKRYQEAIGATALKMYTVFAVSIVIAHIKKVE
jgi:hypothetical protein